MTVEELEILGVRFVIPIFFEKLFLEIKETVFTNRLAHLLHQLDEEMEVVRRAEVEAEHLVGTNQVVDVCARVVFTRVAVTLLIDWTEVGLMFRVLDRDASF